MAKFSKKSASFNKRCKEKSKNVKKSMSDINCDSDEDINNLGSDVDDRTDSSESESDINLDIRPSNGKQNDENDDESSHSENEDEFSSHKQALSKLKDTDPDFYKFLEENDKKLLQFDVSDSESDSDDSVHKPPDTLEGDSDESDYEDKDKSKEQKKYSKVITLAKVQEWRENLINDPSISNISVVVKAFQAALDRVTGETTSEYKVDGSSVFNSVVELCVMNLQPAILKFLKLSPGQLRQPEKSKRWIKIRSILQTYFSDLLKLLKGVTSNHIISVLLKHLHGSCALVICYHKLSRLAIKLLSKLWSSGEETVRVLAYLCILRLVTISKENKNTLLNHSLKLLYIAYVKGSKFVSINTLPQINFMRRSLADLFTIVPSLSYQHAFLYIRQLAIHLRNAITLKKKENFQTVYNWQYIHSLHIWVELLCSKKEELQQLLYPLVTIIIGCIKMIPTAQYVPLRFHCINMLIKLNREIDVFVPVLPYIMETFSVVNLNIKHKKVSMKPLDLSCILRLSKGSMTESAFTDAVIDNCYSLLIEASYNHHSSISFPDLIVPTVVQLKNVIKTTKASKYQSKLKEILMKLEENAKFINSERNKLSVNLSDSSKIKAFEANVNLKGTPLGKFREKYQKSQVVIRTKKVEKQENTEIELPKIRKDLKRKPVKEGPVELFPSDDESGDEKYSYLSKPDDVMLTDPSPSSNKKAKVIPIIESNKDLDESSNDDDDDNEQDDIVEELNISSF